MFKRFNKKRFKKDRKSTFFSKFKVKSNKPKEKTPKKRKSGKYLSLQYKLIGSLVIFASLPVIIVSILSIRANVATIEDSVGAYSQRMVQQFGYTFDNIIDQGRNTLTQFILADDSFKAASLEEKGDDHYENYMRETEIGNGVQGLLNANNMLDGIILATSEGDIYYRDEFKALDDEIQALEETNIFDSDTGKAIRESKSPYWFNTIDGEKMGLYIGWGYDSYGTDTSGIIIVAIGLEQPNKLIKTFNIEDVSDFYIINDNKETIVSTDEDSVGSVLELSYIDKIYEEGYENNTFIDSGELVSCYTFKNGWNAIYRAPLAGLMEDVNQARNTTIMVALSCILLAVVIGFIIAVSISRPINKLRAVMAEAETGNLNVEYKLRSNNEVGQLVGSFNNMLDHIKSLIMDTKNVTETIESKTQTLQVVSESTATSSNEITRAIESIAAGTENQTEQIVRSSQMMNSLAENINTATDKVEDVQAVANNTMEISDETVSIMEELNEQTEETIRISEQIEYQIEDLGKEAEQITGVIAMIQSISEQTNLLALNATIEAARAGEAGRGFAVVADEIRKLANESSGATSTIEEIIQSIMDKKETTIKGAREANELFSLQRPIVSHTNDAFENIHSEMESVVGELDELRELFKEITQLKDDTVVAINEISDIIGHSASASEEVFATSAEQSTSADQIAEMANILQIAVEELKKSQQKFTI